jgi:hypothetical protein
MVNALVLNRYSLVLLLGCSRVCLLNGKTVNIEQTKEIVINAVFNGSDGEA